MTVKWDIERTLGDVEILLNYFDIDMVEIRWIFYRGDKGRNYTMGENRHQSQFLFVNAIQWPWSFVSNYSTFKFKTF